MIALQNINFRYAGGNDAGGLENINLTIPDGQVLLLCGKSGCGKTTLTRLINGLIPNYYEGKLTGNVLLNGKNISQLPLYETAKYVGSVFQNPRTQFFTVDTTSELAFGCENQGLPENEIVERVKFIADQFDIDSLMGKNIFCMSGGEKQKIKLARALYADREIIVFDEPLSSIDATSERDFIDLIFSVYNDRTIIIITHNLSCTKFCDKIISMENGLIREIGSHKQLIKNKGLYYELYIAQAKRYKEI